MSSVTVQASAEAPKADDPKEKKTTSKRAWTPDEDELLQKLIKEHGAKRWVHLGSQLPGRTGKQCRERWHNHLSPDVSKEGWTEEEDRKIFELVDSMGTRWAKIIESLPGRSDNAVKNRWYSLMRKQIRHIVKTHGLVLEQQTEAAGPSPSRKRGTPVSAEEATAAAWGCVGRNVRPRRSGGSPVGKRPGKQPVLAVARVAEAGVGGPAAAATAARATGASADELAWLSVLSPPELAPDLVSARSDGSEGSDGGDGDDGDARMSDAAPDTATDESAPGALAPPAAPALAPAPAPEFTPKMSALRPPLPAPAAAPVVASALAPVPAARPPSPTEGRPDSAPSPASSPPSAGGARAAKRKGGARRAASAPPSPEPDLSMPRSPPEERDAMAACTRGGLLSPRLPLLEQGVFEGALQSALAQPADEAADGAGGAAAPTHAPAWRLAGEVVALQNERGEWLGEVGELGATFDWLQDYDAFAA